MIGLVFLLFLFAELWNGRFWLSDFEVYYKAANRILSGENLYRIEADEFYIFKYSPVSAVLFIPFALLPLTFSKIVYWVFYSLIILACLKISVLLVNPLLSREKPGRVNTVVLLTGLVLMVHFLRELHLGQVTFILLLLYLLTCSFLVSGKSGSVGFCISLSLFIKPFGLIFLPYLLFKRKWKAISFFAIYTVILALVPLLFYRSFDMMINQYIAWFNEIVIELGNKQEFSLPANQTVFSVIARYTFLGSVIKSSWVFLAFQSLILTALVILMMLLIKKGIEISRPEILEMIFLMGLIPLLAFSGENSFCLFLPAVILIIIYFRTLSLPVKIASVICFIFLGGNIYDLWGAELSSLFDQISLISIGAMGLCFLMAIFRFRKYY